MNTNLVVVVEPALIARMRERSHRILGQNASNTAKALARDAVALLDLLDHAALVTDETPRPENEWAWKT